MGGMGGWAIFGNDILSFHLSKTLNADNSQGLDSAVVLGFIWCRSVGLGVIRNTNEGQKDKLCHVPPRPPIRDCGLMFAKLNPILSLQLGSGICKWPWANNFGLFGKLPPRPMILMKNPAYGRHQLSRPMQIVGPIQI